MKKRIITLILTAILVSSASISASATEIKNSNLVQIKEVSQERVKETLKSYFNKNLESEKQLKALKNESIEKDSSLEKLNNLKYKLKAKVNDKYDSKLQSYSTNVEINAMSSEDGLIKVNANNNVTCKYKGLNDKSSYTESHVLYLKEIDNKLLVEKDILSLDGDASNVDVSIKNEGLKKSFTNNLSLAKENSYESYMNDQINLVNDKLTNIDKYFPNIQKENARNSKSSKKIYRLNGLSYNGQGAANWALQNVYSPEGYSGNDCTNFASKALCFGGGIKQDFNYWYQDSLRWIQVNGLWEFLTQIKGYCSDYGPDWAALPGDVVQLHNSSKGVFSHTLVVTQKIGPGSVYVSAHSNAAYNVPLTNYTTSGTYDSNRLLSFSFND